MPRRKLSGHGYGYSVCLWIPPVALRFHEIKSTTGVKFFALKNYSVLLEGYETKLGEPKEAPCMFTSDMCWLWAGRKGVGIKG